MTEGTRYGWRSLRIKLIAASVVVEIIMLSLLIWNSMRLAETYLFDLAGRRIQEVVPLLNASLAGPLLQEDFATMGEIVDQIMDEKGLRYVAITDAAGRQVLVRGRAGSNQVHGFSEPAASNLREQAGSPYAVTTGIDLGGRTIGQLLIEVDTQNLAGALDALGRQSLVIASLEVMLTIFLLSVIGLALTRHLRLLGNAAKRMAGGDLLARIPVLTRDEIGDTAQAFNHMADEISLIQSDLREQKDTLQSLMDSVGEGVYGLDTHGNCTFANAACARMLGQDNAQQLVGQNMHQLIHHTLSDGTPNPVEHCLMAKVYQTGRPLHTDHDVMWRKDGSKFAAELWSYPIYKDDQLAGSVVTFIDISARKRMEDALRTLAQNAIRLDRAQFFQEAVKQLVETFQVKYAFIGLLTDAQKKRVRTISVCCDGRIMENFEYNLAGTPCEDIIYGKPGFTPRGASQLYSKDKVLTKMKIESCLGVPMYSSSKEVIGLVSVMDVHPMELQTWSQSLLGVFAARIVNELDRKKAENKLQKAHRELEQRVQDRTQALSTANERLQKEIYERERIEQELRDSDAQMRLVTDAMPMLISYIDTDLRYRFNNRVYKEWFGAPVEQLAGKHVREVIGEELYQRSLPSIERALSGQECAFDEEIRKADGSIRNIYVRFLPHRDNDGRIAGYFTLVTDITERKKAEQERIHRAEKQRDALVREVHHRIKNSLQGVIGLLQRPMQDHPELTQSLESVISQMHSVAIVHGIQSNDPGEDIDLKAIVTAICDAATATTGAPAPVIEQHLQAPFAVAGSQAVAIALIINELVCNAVKHGDADNKNLPVEVSLACHDQSLASVRIFNHHGHLSPNFNFRTGTGLGTGLHLVKSLIPPGSVKLSIAEENDGVVANLELSKTLRNGMT